MTDLTEEEIESLRIVAQSNLRSSRWARKALDSLGIDYEMESPTVRPKDREDTEKESALAH